MLKKVFKPKVNNELPKKKRKNADVCDDIYIYMECKS